jgi:hypothetical protein
MICGMKEALGLSMVLCRRIEKIPLDSAVGTKVTKAKKTEVLEYTLPYTTISESHQNKTPAHTTIRSIPKPSNLLKAASTAVHLYLVLMVNSRNDTSIRHHRICL